MFPSFESTHVLTGLRASSGKKPFFRRGFLPRQRGFPLAQFFLYESERKLAGRQLMLCSLRAEVRET
jgi:hypothetical protein